MVDNNIIKPEIKDSFEIAKLIKEGWDSAYKGIISDEDLKNSDVEKMSERWINIIKSEDNVYIYKEENKILGVIRFGKCEEINYQNIGEIFCLYVRVEEKRKGIGTRLLEFAKNKLIEDGYNKMIIWCLKGNNQGANFYKKHGGDKIKERRFLVRGIKVREEGFMFDFKEEDIKLIKPTIEYKQQAEELIKEIKKYDIDNQDAFAGCSSIEKYDYEVWLKKLDEDLDFENIKPGRVPASTYFSVRKSDNKIIGVVNIRYYFNEYLENYGGHIGYSERPLEKRKGYGYKNLKLALEKCLEIPINKVLVTCNENNIGSAKIIESCGGIYEDTRFCEKENINLKRYWIKLQ